MRQLNAIAFRFMRYEQPLALAAKLIGAVAMVVGTILSSAHTTLWSHGFARG